MSKRYRTYAVMVLIDKEYRFRPAVDVYENNDLVGNVVVPAFFHLRVEAVKYAEKLAKDMKKFNVAGARGWVE